MYIPTKSPAQLVREIEAQMDRLRAAEPTKANQKALADLAKLRAIHGAEAERIRQERRDHHRHMRDVHLGLATEHEYALRLLTEETA